PSVLLPLDQYAKAIADSAGHEQILYGQPLFQIIERLIRLITRSDSFDQPHSHQEGRLPFEAHRLKSELAAIFDQRSEVRARRYVLFTYSFERRIDQPVIVK